MTKQPESTLTPAPYPPTALPVGFLLQNGKYRIESVFDEGGMGYSYTAILVQLDVKVTIKELFLAGKCLRADNGPVSLKSLSAERFEGFKNDFMTEGRSLAKFKHPNLVKVRDIFEENNTAYLIMDYVEGTTLEQYVAQRGGLNEEEALAYIRQIAGALDDIHQQGLLHKDVQPSNIIITDNGMAVLVGMGVTAQFNKPNATPNYAPMEQYIAQYTKKDTCGPFTDVYALSATLYYCLLAEHPYSAIERKNADLAPPKALLNQLDDAINMAVMQGMAINAPERPQSMTEWLHILQPALSKKHEHRYALKPGTALWQGRYRIEALSGSNGQTFVYKAIDLQNGRFVQIEELFFTAQCLRNERHKVISQTLNDEDWKNIIADYEQEAQTLQTIKHPNWIPVLATFQENNTIYKVSEKMDVICLSDYIAHKGPLNEREAVSIIRQVAGAVQALHAGNIIHKDICPDNILIQPQKGALLGGLGIKIDRYKGGGVQDILGFFPMEQYVANTALNKATDVYSLAATLYYCTTGNVPMSVFDRYYANLPAPRQINRHISQDTNSAILQALAVKAEDRYPSVVEFLADLKEFDPILLQKQRWTKAASVILLFLSIAAISFVMTRETPPPTIALPDYDRYRQIADDLSEKGQFKEAVRYYKGLLLLKPNDESVEKAKQEALTGSRFTPQWWHSLEEDWKLVFRQKLGFNGTPNYQNLADIYRLKELYCYDTPIKSLDALRYMTNLEILGCYNTQITELAPIAQLTKLQVLDCSSNQISDLSPLKNLQNLTVLDFSNTSVNNISPLSDLSRLKELYMVNSLVNDLSPVATLTQLTKLYCAKTGISSIEPLQNLPNLVDLYIYNTGVNDLSPLANASRLQTLHCYKTPIKSLEPLKNLQNLQKLHCYDTPIQYLSPITGLTTLKELYISNTAIVTLEAISDCKNLTDLKFDNTRISDLQPLSGLKMLKEISCNKTTITDLNPIAGLTALNALYANGTPIKDLSVLKNLQGLEKVMISSTSIQNLQPLAALKNLKELSCMATAVNDLSPLANLPILNVLDCSKTQVNTLSPLASIGSLSVLNCADTPLSTLEPLSNLNGLKELDCSNTSVKTLQPLEGLKNLKKINCRNTAIAQQEAAAFQRNLQGSEVIF